MVNSENPTLSVSFAKVLQENHSDLRQYLSLQELIPLLRKFELLTTEEWDEISGHHKQLTQQQRVDYLVKLLPRKGEHAYEKFVTCLESEKEHSAHLELAKKMKETVVKLAEIKTLAKSNLQSTTNTCETQEVRNFSTCHFMQYTKHSCRAGLSIPEALGRLD